MDEKNKQDEARYTLRMPTELYQWVQQESDKQYRSANSLIVSLIQQAREKQEKEIKNE